MDAIHWRFYFVYIATLAAMIPTIYFLFPETKGRTLEEIAMVFDGPDAEPDVSRRASVASASASTNERMTDKSVLHHREKV